MPRLRNKTKDQILRADTKRKAQKVVDVGTYPLMHFIVRVILSTFHPSLFLQWWRIIRKCNYILKKISVGDDFVIFQIFVLSIIFLHFQDDKHNNEKPCSSQVASTATQSTTSPCLDSSDKFTVCRFPSPSTFEYATIEVLSLILYDVLINWNIQYWKT